MSAQTNETLVRSLFNAFNARNYNEIEKLGAEKVVWRNEATGETFNGPSGMRKFLEGWVHAFDDGKADVKRMIATDKNVVTEYIGRGTHTGTLQTPNGPIPATHQKAEVPFCDVCTIENGKITSINSYYDAATMMHQLGLLEPAGAHR